MARRALRIGKNVQGVRAGRRRALRQAPRRHVQLGLVGAVPRGRAARPASPATRSSRRRSRSRPTSRRWCAPGSCRRSSTSSPTPTTSTSTRIEAMIGPRTKAILVPNLIGNAPDWDRIRAIADAHGLKVVEDSCDALGATLRGTPTGTRSDISVTSFALVAHHHRGRHRRHGAASTTTSSIDRCLLLRRWGRRSETRSSGRRRATASFFTDDRRHRVRQPLHLRRGRLELRAVRDHRRVRARAARQAPGEPRPAPAQLRRCCPRSSAPGRTCSRCRDSCRRLETGWHMFPILIRPESGIRRARLPGAHGGPRRRHPHGVDRQRHPPARVRRRAAPRARRRAARTRIG